MANGKITLQMLSDMMSSATGRTKTSTELFTRHFFSTIKEALLRDNIIKIKGFGTFKMVVVNARESINVNTGERVSIAEYNKISFTPDKNLKERIN
ncbi:MAG: HU family DNA-binding protein, partial [Bacteroidaceae bacterium]